MLSRLEIYWQFINQKYLTSLTQNKDYSLISLQVDLKKKIQQKNFKRIVFSGMGCSAIVADMIKSFFIDQKIPIQIEVVNDYNLAYFVEPENLKSSQTLFIINSFSGNSVEPFKVYEQIKKITKNIIFLTSGGQLEKVAQAEKISLIRWQLKKPNKTYTLLHAPQFFVMLLDIFSELKIIKSNYQAELLKTARYLKKEFNAKKIKQARQLAKQLKDKEIILLSSPQWHLSLLKLVIMHFNEIALIPAHYNLFHEFTHCEVAVFAAPQVKLAALILEDSQADEYTKNKIKNLIKIFSAKRKQNKNKKLIVIKMESGNFLKNFFSTLLLLQYVTYFLGISYKAEFREVVSKTACKF